jgi:hypothetical protein
MFHWRILLSSFSTCEKNYVKIPTSENMQGIIPTVIIDDLESK